MIAAEYLYFLLCVYNFTTIDIAIFSCYYTLRLEIEVSEVSIVNILKTRTNIATPRIAGLVFFYMK